EARRVAAAPRIVVPAHRSVVDARHHAAAEAVVDVVLELADRRRPLERSRLALLQPQRLGNHPFGRDRSPSVAVDLERRIPARGHPRCLLGRANVHPDERRSERLPRGIERHHAAAGRVEADRGNVTRLHARLRHRTAHRDPHRAPPIPPVPARPPRGAGGASRGPSPPSPAPPRRDRPGPRAAPRCRNRPRSRTGSSCPAPAPCQPSCWLGPAPPGPRRPPGNPGFPLAERPTPRPLGYESSGGCAGHSLISRRKSETTRHSCFFHGAASYLSLRSRAAPNSEAKNPYHRGGLNRLRSSSVPERAEMLVHRQGKSLQERSRL